MEGAVFALAPGKSWKLRLGKRVRARPGVYRGILSYRSGLAYTKDGPETEGEIPIDLGEMIVVPSRR